MLWTPPMGVNVGTETSFFWGLPPAYVWFWALSWGYSVTIVIMSYLNI
jgi:hypothetical protein